MKKISRRFTTFLIVLFCTISVVAALRMKADDSARMKDMPERDLNVIQRVLDLIQSNYVDQSLVKPETMIDYVIRILSRSLTPFLAKREGGALMVSYGEKKLELPASVTLSMSEAAHLLSKILSFIDMTYDGPLDMEDRLSLLMSGVMDSLDAHSNYLSTKNFAEFKISAKGNFGGLGIVIGLKEGELSVIEPIEGTPAQRAGLKANDRIVQIGEESTINMGLNEAVDKLRGPVGSNVSIVIKRDHSAPPAATASSKPSPTTAPAAETAPAKAPKEDETIKLTLTRALIQIQSVAGRLIGDPNKRFALIRVRNFQEDTVEQFEKTIRSFAKDTNHIEGLILDLRNNPGGLLDQAIALSDFFLADGVIVKTVGSQGQVIELEKAAPGDGGETLPLVVLVNENSASASEIVSGTLQLNDRAVVIGNRSFGKGSVQTVYDLKDGSALKLTIAKYLTAKDQVVQSVGINPDIGLVAAVIPKAIDEKKIDLFANDIKRELDLEEMQRDEEHKDPNLPPSPINLTYLDEEKEEEAESSGKIPLKEDFPVVLASRILGLSRDLMKYLPVEKAIQRPDVLGAAPALIEEMRKGEDEKMRKELARVGVDWSATPKDGSPKGTVTLELMDAKGQPRKGLAAGEAGFLKATLVNQGSGPFSRLAAVTETDDPIFSNLEFAFGRVAAGETKVWKTPLKIPNFVHRRQIPISLTFHEEYGHFPKTEPLSLQVEETSDPLFAYSYRVLDDGSRSTRGNGNKKVDAGETIGLLVKIKNIGTGESHEPVLNLKKVDGNEVFLEKGREELKPLAAGAETESFVSFRVPSKMPEKLSFDLNIHDAHLGEDLTDHINFYKPPTQAEWMSPPKVDVAWDKLELLVSSSNYKISGLVTDDHEIKHLVVFVGEDKVHYEAPPAVAPGKPSTSFAFETSVILKKGANLITVAAQDDRELTSRRQWIVWRE